MTTLTNTTRGVRRFFGGVLRTNAGRVGLMLLAVTVFLALFGSLLAPYNPTATVGIPGQGPGPGHLLGLDFVGRDVLSRVLSGGRSTLLLAVSAIVLTYVIGAAIGLTAGFSRSWLDPILMRAVDILRSMPALLTILLLVTALGSDSTVLIVATSLVMLPGVARVLRSATLVVSTRGYVEAAVARGESMRAVLTREVLPNIAGVITADFGLRFAWAIILIANVNFLGVGIRPPTPDWGVTIAENRVVIASNPMATVGPAVILAMLIIGVSLVGDAYVRQLDRSDGDR